jgi:thiol-disulfide isomerase/thioredoxin
MNVVRIFRYMFFWVCCALIAAQGWAELVWQRDWEKALAQAKRENKLIFMDVYADWCGPCRMMDQITFADAGVKERLAKYVTVKVDADKDTALAERYGTGALPTLAIVQSDGALLQREAGFQEPKQLLGWLETGEERLKTVTALAEEVAAKPKDTALALALAKAYLEMSAPDRARDVLLGAKATGAEIADRAAFDFTLGSALVDSGAYEQGVAAMEQFLREFPEDGRAEDARQKMSEGVFRLAHAALDAEQYEAAIAGFRTLTTHTEFPGVVRYATMRLATLELLGKPAPEWSVAEWLSGQASSVAGQSGKVTLVAFFESPCPVCGEMNPILEQWQSEYGPKGLSIVGITFSESDSGAEEARKEVSARPVKWPVALDANDGDTYKRYGCADVPWFVLIDRSGKLRYNFAFDPDSLVARMEKLLAESS